MNKLKISINVISIINKYLLPSKIDLTNKKKKCLKQLLKNTWYIKNSFYMKSKYTIKYTKFRNEWFLVRIN